VGKGGTAVAYHALNWLSIPGHTHQGFPSLPSLLPTTWMHPRIPHLEPWGQEAPPFWVPCGGLVSPFRGFFQDLEPGIRVRVRFRVGVRVRVRVRVRLRLRVRVRVRVRLRLRVKVRGRGRIGLGLGLG
jgi:hypothetical protein